MNTIIIIVSIIVAIFVVSRYLRNVKKHSAAMNALVAKATYEQLPADLRKQVVNNTLFILQRDGGFSSDRVQEHLKQMDEKTKYSFFALSMI